MAANPRRIMVGVYREGTTRLWTEMDDFISWDLVYNKDGGFVSATVQLLRPFQDYRGLNNPNNVFEFYYNNTLIFQGRLRHAESDWQNKSMTVVFEGRDSWLKEIYDTIEINPETYPGGPPYYWYSGGVYVGEIDLVYVAAILWDKFIKGKDVPGFWAANDNDLYARYGSEYAIPQWGNVFPSGVTVSSWSWDGSVSLWEVFQSLSMALGGDYAWGFAQPKSTAHGLFYFKSGASVTYPMLIPSDERLPYIVSCQERIPFDYSPGRLNIIGGWNPVLQRRLTFSRVNPNPLVSKAATKTIVAPWVDTGGKAEALSSSIFSMYSDLKPEYDVVIRNLSAPITPGMTVILNGETGQLTASKPSAIEYQLNTVISAKITTGNLLEPQTGLEGKIDQRVQAMIDLITMRPAMSGSPANKVASGAQFVKITSVSPLKVKMIDEGAQVFGDEISATVEGSHSNAFAVGQVVQGVWIYPDDNPDGAYLYLVNFYSLAT